MNLVILCTVSMAAVVLHVWHHCQRLSSARRMSDMDFEIFKLSCKQRELEHDLEQRSDVLLSVMEERT